MFFIPPRFAAAQSLIRSISDWSKSLEPSRVCKQAGQDHDDRPHLLAAVAYDEYYNDMPKMMGDFGKLLHQNLKRLAEAGCKHIQIDEPYFTVAAKRKCCGRRCDQFAIEGLPDDVHVMVHICQGNYAVGPDYDGQIGHRYFDRDVTRPISSARSSATAI